MKKSLILFLLITSNLLVFNIQTINLQKIAWGFGTIIGLAFFGGSCMLLERHNLYNEIRYSHPLRYEEIASELEKYKVCFISPAKSTILLLLGLVMTKLCYDRYPGNK